VEDLDGFAVEKFRSVEKRFGGPISERWRRLTCLGRAHSLEYIIVGNNGCHGNCVVAKDGRSGSIPARDRAPGTRDFQVSSRVILVKICIHNVTDGITRKTPNCFQQFST
jgi:hypothetical protein